MADGTEEQNELAERLAQVAGAEDARLVTTDAASGEPRETVLYFAVAGRSVYLLAGAGEETPWVRDIRARPEATIHIGGEAFRGTAHVIQAADHAAKDAIVRRLLATKYERWREGKPLSSWARIALPVALEVTAVAG